MFRCFKSNLRILLIFTIAILVLVTIPSAISQQSNPIESITLDDMTVYPSTGDKIWTSNDDPILNWELSPGINQKGYRVMVFESGTGDQVYDTGSEWVKSPLTLHAIEAGLSEGDYNGFLLVLSEEGEIYQEDFTNWGVDVSPPVAENIMIENGDEFTPSREVNLLLSAKDNMSGIITAQFRVNNQGWGSWEPYQTHKKLELPSGDGLKIVFFRVRNGSGLLSSSTSSTIRLDTTPPNALDFKIENGLEFTNSASVNLNLSAQDHLSGVESFRIKIENGEWDPWQPFTENHTYNLSHQEGEKTLSVKFKDNVGNVSENLTASITLDNTPPNLEIISPENSQLDNSKINLKVKVNDNYNLKESKVKVKIDGELVTHKLNGENLTADLELTEGPHQVTITAEDEAGNTKTIESVFTVELPQTGQESKEGKGGKSFPYVLIAILVIVVGASVILILNRSRVKKWISQRRKRSQGGL